MERFPQRKRIRIPEYSYSQRGSYFITICTSDKLPILARVTGRDHRYSPEVILSQVGEIVNQNILRISAAYPAIRVDKYVIMPNHVHLLLSVTEEWNGDNGKRDKMLVSKCIQSFKASVSRQAPAECRSVWQSRFNDHVVRNEADYRRIWQYIDDNPAKWMDDCYYVK